MKLSPSETIAVRGEPGLAEAGAGEIASAAKAAASAAASAGPVLAASAREVEVVFVEVIAATKARRPRRRQGSSQKI
jgi:hypothetical protein